MADPHKDSADGTLGNDTDTDARHAFKLPTYNYQYLLYQLLPLDIWKYRVPLTGQAYTVW